jgi:hypothetical protein
MNNKYLTHVCIPTLPYWKYFFLSAPKLRLRTGFIYKLQPQGKMRDNYSLSLLETRCMAAQYVTKNM